MNIIAIGFVILILLIVIVYSVSSNNTNNNTSNRGNNTTDTAPNIYKNPLLLDTELNNIKNEKAELEKRLAQVLLQFEVLENERKLQLKELEEKHKEDLKKHADNTLNTSRKVLKGKVTEELIPFLPGFPYVASDIKFIGSPIDFICFHNMTENRDGDTEELIEIVFVDIKTGKSNLTSIQKKIKEAVEQKRISWKTLTFNEEVGKVEEVIQKPKKKKD